MAPYLLFITLISSLSVLPTSRTGIQAGPSEPAADPPAGNFCVDPLEESSSWYPPVWCLASEQDLRLVDVPAGTLAYQSVQNLFCKSLPETMVDIISIQQVQNLLHWDKYQRSNCSLCCCRSHMDLALQDQCIIV